MPGSSSTSVGHVSTPKPHPLPGPTGLGTDELRVAFDDLLADSVGHVGLSPGGEPTTVRDDQVAALDAAHELLADALSAVDARH